MVDELELRMISEIVAAQIVIARSLPLEDVEEWAAVAHKEVVRYDTVVSMLDPTSYRENRAAIQAAADVAQAYFKFRKVVEEVKAHG